MSNSSLADPRPAEPPTAPDRPPVVLVVDDNEMNREMLSQFFRTQGYAVLTAEHGEETLRLVEAGPVDLILLDIMMPDMSGLEVLERLRRQHGMTDLPVIMATAKDRTEDVVEALNLGANDYVIKPLDLAVVLARARTQLSLKRATSEIRRLAQELEIRNRFIRRTFGRYLSDEVVASLLETPEGLRLGGDKRLVTLLMSDLRGFTALAERLAPEQVLRLLNNYLGTMTEIIARHQGTIDEFMGDGILALFGAPIAREDDVERACACAVAMQRAMREVNARNAADGLPTVEMGVAVNTGEVIVGNIGSQMRAKYGVVGTHVNLTSRLQSFTLGGQVLVSDSTLSHAHGRLETGETLNVHPKGFQGPIVVHELMAVNGAHAVRLPEEGQELRPVPRQVVCDYWVMHGERSHGAPLAAHFVKVSDRAALLRAAEPLAPFSVLRLRVRDLEVGGEVQARVLGEGQPPGTYHVRFTTQGAEVERLVQALLDAN